jgi:peptidoglycan/LPS O-acetylase OafA/YrhL
MIFYILYSNFSFEQNMITMSEIRQVRKHNTTVDSFRVSAVLLVIYFHLYMFVDLPNQLFIYPLTRLAVPLFFFITGFYISYSTADKGAFQGTIVETRCVRLAKSIKNHFFLLEFAILPNVLMNYWITGHFFTIDFESLKSLIFFNNPGKIDFFLGPMWYLFAAIYALFIMFLLLKVFRERKLFEIAMTVLISALFLFGVYMNQFPDTGELYRNFLFFALPVIWLGYITGAYIEKIMNFFSSRKKLVLYYTVTILITFADIFYSEYKTVDGTSIYNNEAMMFFAPFLCFTIIIFSMRHPNLFGGKLEFIPRWGRKYSRYIYVLHGAVGFSLKQLNVYSFFDPQLYLFIIFIIFFVSLFLSFLYVETKNIILDRFK